MLCSHSFPQLRKPFVYAKQRYRKRQTNRECKLAHKHFSQTIFIYHSVANHSAQAFPKIRLDSPTPPHFTYVSPTKFQLWRRERGSEACKQLWHHKPSLRTMFIFIANTSFVSFPRLIPFRMNSISRLKRINTFVARRDAQVFWKSALTIILGLIDEHTLSRNSRCAWISLELQG